MDDACEHCDGTGWADLPDINTSGPLRRLRFWLIHLLARGDVVMLNGIVATPPGWSVNKRDLDQGALVRGNAFATFGWTAPPGTRVLYRDELEEA